MTKNELSLDELNKVAGGMSKQSGPRLPTGTGPTFPTDPFPFPIPFGPFGPWNKI